VENVFLDELQEDIGAAYRLERELGGGGMARVVLAQDVALRRSVVVKILAPELSAGVNVERFAREVQLAARLQHPHIVPILTAGDAGGLPYYTMPYVSGESLREVVTRGPLPMSQAISILRDVAKALAFAHGQGVVHRDIKPDNVLLSAGTAVVTDFGIAKAIAAAGGDRPERDSAKEPSPATLTSLGMAIGTPAYMAPEQAAADPNVDRRADLYAFGCMAYELLSGAVPFAVKSPMALFAAHLTERAPSVIASRPDTPPSLDRLITACLEKEPSARPQNASDVLAALDAAVVELALGAHPAVTPSRPIVRPSDSLSIAVMPFANLSPDPDDEYFADGLTDEIITDLAPMRSLRVIARASMMRYKGTDREPIAVARELNTRYVLDGSVRRAGQSLRLTVRLTDSATATTVWSDKLGGTVDDVFAMQERISRTIVDALRLTLSPQEERRLAERPIVDMRAYESYLQARQALWTFTVPSMERARRLVENALALVGDNPRLLATLGAIRNFYLETGDGDLSEHLAAAEQCARRLGDLEPDSAAVFWLRGSIHLRRGEIRESIEVLERAYALEPNNADVVLVLAYACTISGRDARARHWADEAILLDPLTPLLQCMPGFCEHVQGRSTEALPYYRKFIAMDPMNPAAHFFLLSILLHTGDTDEIIRVGTHLAREFPDTPFGQIAVAYLHAARGDKRAAMAAMTPELRASTKRSELFARSLASLYGSIGETDAAFEAVRDAVRFGLSHYPFLSQHDHLLDSVRGDPRFIQLLEVVRGRWERGGASAADHAGATS
jgi:serine/threonine protein kinase/tetratricopeptide (TPR) repeat protein